MERPLKEQSQGEILPNDLGQELPSDAQCAPASTGIWKYAEDFGVNPALVLMARRYVQVSVLTFGAQISF
jgi:hypothetical protein